MPQRKPASVIGRLIGASLLASISAALVWVALHADDHVPNAWDEPSGTFRIVDYAESYYREIDQLADFEPDPEALEHPCDRMLQGGDSAKQDMKACQDIAKSGNTLAMFRMYQFFQKIYPGDAYTRRWLKGATDGGNFSALVASGDDFFSRNGFDTAEKIYGTLLNIKTINPGDSITRGTETLAHDGTTQSALYEYYLQQSFITVSDRDRARHIIRQAGEAAFKAKDYEKAYRWLTLFRQVDDIGHEPLLNSMYAKGLGIPKDWRRISYVEDFIDLIRIGAVLGAVACAYLAGARLLKK